MRDVDKGAIIAAVAGGLGVLGVTTIAFVALSRKGEEPEEEVELIIDADADASVLLSNPDIAWGDRAGLWCRTYETTGQTERTFIRFSLPYGMGEVISAKLCLFYEAYYRNNPSGRLMDLHRVAAPWDEATITWNNQPDYLLPLINQFIMPASPGVWTEIDVTGEIGYLRDHPDENFGWCLKFNDESYTQRVDFQWLSRNAASINKPCLVICYLKSS